MAAAIDFPASPSTGQLFTASNTTWQWDGTTWVAYNPTSGNLIFSAGTIDAGVVSTGSSTVTQTSVLPNSLPSPYVTKGSAVVSNGNAWEVQLIGGFSNMVVLTSTNAAYSIPATKIKVTVIGGGGGSGYALRSCSSGATGGGGGGGAAVKILSGLTIGATLNITVGTGGTAGSSSGVNGGTGNTSSVASGTQTISTISATGGSGTTAVNDALSSGGAGGLGSGGDLNTQGGGGGAGTGGTGGTGGSSILGGGGQTIAGDGAGTAGGAYGGGASGGSALNNPRAGAAGAAGVVIVEY